MEQSDDGEMQRGGMGRDGRLWAENGNAWEGILA